MNRAMQFDRAKLRAAILYTCRSVDPDSLGAVKLHKVLYFLDMIHYAQSGNPVTGATYKKRPYGPTCVQLLSTLREMADEQLLEIRDVDFFGLRKKEYHPLAKEPAGLLNESETALLEEVLDLVCRRHSARTISDYSHQLPWEMAEYGEEIPYHTALLLFPVEITPEAFEAVEEGLDQVAEARSRGDAVGFAKLADFRSRISSEIGQG